MGVSTEPPSFGDRLRQLRLRAGLSRDELAERSGVSVPTILALELGRRRQPHPRTLANLSEALGLLAGERADLLELTTGSAADVPGPAAASVARLSVSPARLPQPPTALIGREAELAQACSLLVPSASTVRLLTLLGPGGVGKTRLALAVAESLGARYPAGVVFVDLAPLRDARLVPATIARALELREGGGRSARELLLDVLRDQRRLLVLDNFEHLLAAAPLLAELLAACPRLALLVTSRAALRLRSERRFAVQPLATPDVELALQAVAAAPAVRLFVERAQDVAPDFALEPSNAQAVVTLCRRLDGLPLAIELAAARAGVLGPAALLRRLDRRLSLLTGGGPDLPERQQTLRSTLLWSYELLDPPAQLLLGRLAVFVGGWTLEAAEAVCADAALAVEDVVENLAALLDNSLVRQQATGAVPRFGMLETIREFALERLTESGQAEASHRRHRDWLLALAERVEPEWVEPAHVAELDREQDNLRAALRWSVDRHDASAGLRLAIAGGHPLWYLRGRYAEGRAWMRELLALDDALDEPGLRAAALVWAAQLAHCEGATSDAESLLQQGLLLAESVSDGRAIANAEQIMGNVARGRGDLAAATQHYTRARLLAQREGRWSTASWVLYCLAMTCVEQGEHDRLSYFVAQLAEVLTVHDNPTAAARLLVLRAHLSALDGDDATANALLESGLAHIGEQGDQQGLAYAHRLAAHAALDRSDWTAAAEHLGQMLSIARATSDRPALAWALDGVGELLAANGQPQRAVRLAAAANALRMELGIDLVPIEVTRRQRWFERARQALREDAEAVLGTPLAEALADASAACATSSTQS